MESICEQKNLELQTLQDITKQKEHSFKDKISLIERQHKDQQRKNEFAVKCFEQKIGLLERHLKES